MSNDTKIYNSLSNLIKKKKYKLKEDAIERADAFFANDKFNSMRYNELINLINENYQEDSTPYPVDKISVLNSKIKFIDNYKHEARLFFPYGNCGGIQRFTTDDIALINLTIDGLKDRTIDVVKWKYSNGNYDVVDKTDYLDEMKRIGGRLTVEAFAVEEIVVNELKLLETVDDLLLYDEKSRFDELFYDEDTDKK